jgi:hypothetical protein
MNVVSLEKGSELFNVHACDCRIKIRKRWAGDLLGMTVERLDVSELLFEA